MVIAMGVSVWQRFLLASASCLLVLAFACDGDDPTEPPLTGTPELTIPQPSFDFGLVPQYSVIAHRFWLYSTGTDTLRILDINPG